MRRAHRSATDGRGRNRSWPEAVRRCPRVRREHPAPIARPNRRNAGLADTFEPIRQARPSLPSPSPLRTRLKLKCQRIKKCSNNLFKLLRRIVQKEKH